jgi:multidrug efflux system outer membrane protein
MNQPTLFLKRSIALGMTLLSGCFAPKQQQASKSELSYPQNWESNLTIPEDSNSTYGWASSLGGDVLQHIIEDAWSGNPSLTAMTERLIAQGEQATILGANLLPTAQVEVSGSRSKRNLIGFNLPNGSTSFTSNSFTSGLNISWELDLWGKIADARDSAEKRFQAGSLDLEAAKLSLSGQVSKVWYEIIEGSEQLTLANQSASSFAQNEIFVKERFRKGLANALEQNLAQSGTASARARALALDRQLNQNKRRLNVLLGNYPSVNLDLNYSSKLTPLPELKDSLESPSTALTQRPDVQAAEKNAEASGLDLSIARKNFFPSLTVSGGPGSRSDEFENLLDKNFQTWGLNGSFSQPIFNGGRLRAAQRQAKAMQAAAWADYRTTALEAFTELENLLSAEQNLAQEEAFLQQAANSAEEASKLSWERYQRGVEGIFNALENQRRAFEARSRALLIRKQRIHNRIDLHLALGQSPLPPSL